MARIPMIVLSFLVLGSILSSQCVAESESPGPEHYNLVYYSTNYEVARGLTKRDQDLFTEILVYITTLLGIGGQCQQLDPFTVPELLGLIDAGRKYMAVLSDVCVYQSVVDDTTIDISNNCVIGNATTELGVAVYETFLASQIIARKSVLKFRLQYFMRNGEDFHAIYSKLGIHWDHIYERNEWESVFGDVFQSLKDFVTDTLVWSSLILNLSESEYEGKISEAGKRLCETMALVLSKAIHSSATNYSASIPEAISSLISLLRTEQFADILCYNLNSTLDREASPKLEVYWNLRAMELTVSRLLEMKNQSLSESGLSIVFENAFNTTIFEKFNVSNTISLISDALENNLLLKARYIAEVALNGIVWATGEYEEKLIISEVFSKLISKIEEVVGVPQVVYPLKWLMGLMELPKNSKEYSIYMDTYNPAYVKIFTLRDLALFLGEVISKMLSVQFH